MSPSLYAYPRNNSELKQAAVYLERLFTRKSGTATSEYRLAKRKFRWIRRRISDALARQIEKDVPAGLYLRWESRREYPFGKVGKQILGFTDIDNTGCSGYELSHNSLLSGKNGFADIRRDGLRNTYRVKESALVKPVSGASVVLTVDWRLQEIVEEELRRAVEKYNAESAMAVFMDCQQGDILAMAHYDPAEKNPDRPVKLRAVSDQFEPGSVIKAFTAAGLLDNGLINFADSIYCENGKWRMGRRILHDDKELEWLSFREVMELSSNIGIAKHAITLGGDELLTTFRGFGMGQKPDVGLPSEACGVVRKPSRWSDYNIASVAMGHAVATSALQLASGFAAIANGGELLRPKLLLGLVDKSGYVVDRQKRESLGRAMERSSVDSLHAFLRGVVERGTAELANSPSVAIAGKTGTAQIPDLENHRYYRHRFMASFAGFFPAEAPVIAGVVVLEAPRPVTYGGWTAGPTFRRVTESYLVLNPDLFSVADRVLTEQSDRANNTREVPDLSGHDMMQARQIADGGGFELHSSVAEGTVAWQFPPPGRLVFDGAVICVAVELGSTESAMPDVTGLPLRHASAYLAHKGITYTTAGNGMVVKQSIRPGTFMSPGVICRITCKPTGRSLLPSTS
jgi:cell division protein FtsI/penicillin-binding protein 2